MPTEILSQVIDRPVADVFAVVADITTYPDWDPPVKAARQATDGEVEVGTLFETEVSGFGTQVMEVTEFEPGRGIRSTAQSRGLDFAHRLTFSAEGQSTRIDHEVVLTPKGVLRVLSPLLGVWVRRTLAGSAAGLQQYCEGLPGASRADD